MAFKEINEWLDEVAPVKKKEHTLDSILEAEKNSENNDDNRGVERVGDPFEYDEEEEFEEEDDREEE